MSLELIQMSHAMLHNKYIPYVSGVDCIYMCMYVTFQGRFSPPLLPRPLSSPPAPTHCRAPLGSSSGSVCGSRLFSAPTLICCPWCGSSAAPYCWEVLVNGRWGKRGDLAGEWRREGERWNIQRNKTGLENRNEGEMLRKYRKRGDNGKETKWQLEKSGIKNLRFLWFIYFFSCLWQQLWGWKESVNSAHSASSSVKYWHKMNTGDKMLLTARASDSPTRQSIVVTAQWFSNGLAIYPSLHAHLCRLYVVLYVFLLLLLFTGLHANCGLLPECIWF